MLEAYHPPLPQPPRHNKSRLHAHDQHRMLTRGRSTEVSAVALARRASDERRKQMTLQVHAYDPPLSQCTLPPSRNSTRTIRPAPRDHDPDSTAGPSKAPASSPPSTSATALSSPSTCYTPIEPHTPPDNDNPYDYLHPSHALQSDTRAAFVDSELFRMGKGKSKTQSHSSPSPSSSPSSSALTSSQTSDLPPPSAPSPEELRKRALRLRAEAKRREVLHRAERVWEEIMLGSRREKARIIMERARLEEEEKEREHMRKEAERIDHDRQRRAHAFPGQFWTRSSLRSQTIPQPAPQRPRPKDEPFTYSFPMPKASMQAPSSSASKSVSALGRPTPASASKTRRQLAALLAPPSHAPSTNPRIIPFKVVLSSMNGPLFPPSDEDLPSSSVQQTHLGSWSSRASLDAVARRREDELLSELLNPVKWEEQERWPAQGQSEITRVRRRTRRNSCKACMGAPISSSFISSISVSSPTDTMVSTSSSSFASSWLSFGSRKSTSTARTTPTSSPAPASSLLSITTKKPRESTKLPSHTCRKPFQPSVFVDLYHSPLAPPPEPVSTKHSLKESAIGPGGAVSGPNSRLSGHKRKALHSVAKLGENLRSSMTSMLSLASMVQEAYVAATILGLQAQVADFESDSDSDELEGEDDDLHIRWGSPKGKGGAGSKWDGWRASPNDVATFVRPTKRGDHTASNSCATQTTVPYVLFPLVAMRRRSDSDSRSPSRSPSPPSQSSSYSYSNPQSRPRSHTAYDYLAYSSSKPSYAHSYAAFAANHAELNHVRDSDDGMYAIPAAFPSDDMFDNAFGTGYDYSHPRVGCRTRHVANPVALRVKAASNVWYRREKEKATKVETTPGKKHHNPNSSTPSQSKSKASVDAAWAGILIRPEAMGSGKERVVGIAFDVFAKGGLGVAGGGVGSRCERQSALRWGWRVVWGEEDDY